MSRKQVKPVKTTKVVSKPDGTVAKVITTTNASLPHGWGKKPDMGKRVGTKIRTKEEKERDDQLATSRRDTANLLGHLRQSASLQETEYYNNAMINSLRKQMVDVQHSREAFDLQSSFDGMVKEITSSPEYQKGTEKIVGAMQRKIKKITKKAYKKAKKQYGKKWAKLMFGKLVDKKLAKLNALIKEEKKIVKEEYFESEPPRISPHDLGFGGNMGDNTHVNLKKNFDEKEMAMGILGKDLPVGGLDEEIEGVVTVDGNQRFGPFKEVEGVVTVDGRQKYGPFKSEAETQSKMKEKIKEDVYLDVGGKPPVKVSHLDKAEIEKIIDGMMMDKPKKIQKTK